MGKSKWSDAAVRADGEGQLTEAGRLAVASLGGGKGRRREWWRFCSNGRHQAGESYVLISVVERQL